MSKKQVCPPTLYVSADIYIYRERVGDREIEKEREREREREREIMKDVRMSTCKLSLMNDHTVSEVDSTTNSIEHETCTE